MTKQTVKIKINSTEGTLFFASSVILDFGATGVVVIPGGSIVIAAVKS